MPKTDFRLQFDAADLLQRHPPDFQHPHKRMLFESAYSSDSPPSGCLEVSRWLPEPLSQIAIPFDLTTSVVTGYYDYRLSDPSAKSFEWHVNFSDPHLFVAYGSRLFAQDEMQVMEHPLLGAVREAIVARKYAARTTDGDNGTPILVKNVERRLEIATEPDAAAGRPWGLYGNRFATAPAEVVKRATTVVDPPTFSNLIAMAAPAYGQGTYLPRDISYVLQTALLGFSAACHESTGSPVIVHSGFWGCGAFGGNRPLMIALQAVAAGAAGVSRLVLHVGDESASHDAEQGLRLAQDLTRPLHPTCDATALIERFTKLGCQWGVSDGN